MIAAVSAGALGPLALHHRGGVGRDAALQGRRVLPQQPRRLLVAASTASEQGGAPTPQPPSKAEIRKLPKGALEMQLKERGLAVDGVKEKQVVRLYEALKKEAAAAAVAVPKAAAPAALQPAAAKPAPPPAAPQPAAAKPAPAAAPTAPAAAKPAPGAAAAAPRAAKPAPPPAAAKPAAAEPAQAAAAAAAPPSKPAEAAAAPAEALAAVAGVQPNMEDLAANTKEQLSAMLAAMGLPKSGSKPELIQRVLAAGPLPPGALEAASALPGRGTMRRGGTTTRKAGGTTTRKAAGSGTMKKTAGGGTAAKKAAGGGTAAKKAGTTRRGGTTRKQMAPAAAAPAAAARSPSPAAAAAATAKQAAAAGAAAAPPIGEDEQRWQREAEGFTGSAGPLGAASSGEDAPPQQRRAAMEAEAEAEAGFAAERRLQQQAGQAAAAPAEARRQQQQAGQRPAERSASEEEAAAQLRAAMEAEAETMGDAFAEKLLQQRQRQQGSRAEAGEAAEAAAAAQPAAAAAPAGGDDMLRQLREAMEAEAEGMGEAFADKLRERQRRQGGGSGGAGSRQMAAAEEAEQEEAQAAAPAAPAAQKPGGTTLAEPLRGNLAAGFAVPDAEAAKAPAPAQKAPAPAAGSPKPAAGAAGSPDLEALAAASAERIRSGQADKAASQLEERVAAMRGANRVGGAAGTGLLALWRAATEGLARMLGGGNGYVMSWLVAQEGSVDAATAAATATPPPPAAAAAAGSATGSGANRSSDAGSTAAEDLFAAPVLLHGAVPKSGMLDPKQWHKKWAAHRRRTYTQWLTAQGESRPFDEPPASSLPQPAPIAFPHCKLYVNHGARFIYIRHAKSASTSLLQIFKFCDAKKQLVSGRDNCIEHLDGSLSVEELEAMWRDYVVFTAVRNPYSRAISQYKFMLRKVHARPECEQMSWDRFCAFPPSLGLACRRRPECCLHKEGFAYIHLISQATCMSTQDGRPAVDYVLRVERLEEDLGGLFARINSRLSAGVAPLEAPAAGESPRVNVAAGGKCMAGGQEAPTHPTYRGHATLDARERYCNAGEYFWRQRHPHCLAQLNSFLSADLKLLMRGGTAEGRGGSGR